MPGHNDFEVNYIFREILTVPPLPRDHFADPAGRVVHITSVSGDHVDVEDGLAGCHIFVETDIEAIRAEFVHQVFCQLAGSIFLLSRSAMPISRSLSNPMISLVWNSRSLAMPEVNSAHLKMMECVP